MTQKNPHLKPAVNRIVIGDVGSGKTIVAFTTALVYLQQSSDLQVSLLAPTEVLAFQHYEKLVELITKEDLDFVIPIFLSGKQKLINGQKFTPKKFDTELQKIIDTSDKNIFWVGTHALLFEKMVKPTLVLVDEQHRFGVKQRQQLSAGEYPAHFISFTATPIPRTMALTVYKYLQPLFLEKLDGRGHIQMLIKYQENFESEVVPEIKKHVENGRKIYIVCPKIEEGEEESETWSVGEVTKKLETFFSGQILTVHGKMATKKDILSDFKTSAEKFILVSTTVIEVGVDVAEASLMVVINSERFGLSALHQIRGRVGRNNFNDNQCLLVTPKQYSRSRRLGYLCQSQDGFYLAQKDLEIRGSGDLIGRTQSGFDTDVSRLMELDIAVYQELSDLVESIDIENMDDLPRLENYLKQSSRDVWSE